MCYNQAMKEKHTIKEHILVCLSSSPSNPKVIKVAAQMAKVFDADFTALFIETSKEITPENKKRLDENTKIAKQCGAKIVTVNGDDIAYQVSQYAKTSKVTKIVIGRSGYKPNRFLAPLNFVDKLISMASDIEVYIIPDKVQKIYIGRVEKKQFELPKLTWKDSLTSLGFLILATLVGAVFQAFNINVSNTIMVYILGVLLISYFTESKFYSLTSSILSVLVFNFFFTEPHLSFRAYDPGYPFTFLIMFLVAFMASSITKKTKEYSRKSSEKAYSMEIMLEMSQMLQQCTNNEEINAVTRQQVGRLLECDVILRTENEEIQDKIEKWVFKNNKQAGHKTDNFSDAKYYYFPISNIDNVFAVMVILKSEISEFEKNLVIAMLRESALAYEKDAILQAKNELLIRNKQEELRSTLLRSISHDLRTPLTSISGYADILMKNSSKLSEETKNKVYNDIYDDSVWLLNLVENLLFITRFNNNKLDIKEESELVSEVISEALAHLGIKKENFNIETYIEDEALSAKMDGRLIMQVIFNLVDNAMKYSPVNTTIKVSAVSEGKYVRISVADEGNGISDVNKQKIFNMFYKVNDSVADGRRGLGIGLALCKAVIDAHGGEIDVQDNKPKGTIFSFKLLGDFDE